MTFPAIPTRYAGVQFRSRLEARWAAFFDLLQWKWDYEPIDLDGYIPDFVVDIVQAYGEERIVFEVKPMRVADMHNGIDDVVRKAFCGGVSKISKTFVVIGHEFQQYDPCFSDGGDIRVGWSSCGRSFDLMLAYGDEHWDWCLGDKDSGKTPEVDVIDAAKRLWREAGNRVQWRGVEARP